METNQMIQVGLLPSKQLTSLLTDENGEFKDIPEGQSIVPLIKIEKPQDGEWEPIIVWYDDRVERQWVAAEPTPNLFYTAEQWLEIQGLGGTRQPSLLYLKLQLDGSQKVSPKINLIQNYLNEILSTFATDPSPRNDWPTTPVSFEDAVAEAMQILQN
jgi:hypothetical protein